MTQELIELDFIFPFVVFFSSLFILIALETRILETILNHSEANAQNPQFSNLKKSLNSIQQRSGLYWVSFFVSGLWSLQHLLA